MAKPRLRALIVFGLLAAVPAAADEAGSLYRAETIVTGTEEPERTRGFRIGLREVVVKLTGKPDFADDPRLAPYLDRVAELVAAFEYEDRLKDIPVHDEQGTRERPHFLRMTFSPGKTDMLLRTLEATKWPFSRRPRILVLLAVGTARATFVLSADGAAGYGQREVFRSASRRRGLPIVIPSRAVMQRHGLSASAVERGDRRILNQVRDGLECGGSLRGILETGDKGYWNVRWQLDTPNLTDRWSAGDVTFDDAIRGAVDRAIAQLSALR